MRFMYRKIVLAVTWAAAFARCTGLAVLQDEMELAPEKQSKLKDLRDYVQDPQQGSSIPPSKPMQIFAQCCNPDDFRYPASCSYFQY